MSLNNLQVLKIQKSSEKHLYTIKIYSLVNIFNPVLMLTGFQTTQQLLKQVSLTRGRDPNKACTRSAVNLIKHVTLISSALEPGMWSRDTGQRISRSFANHFSDSICISIPLLLTVLTADSFWNGFFQAGVEYCNIH